MNHHDEHRDRPAGQDVTVAELEQEDPARTAPFDPIPVVVAGTVRTIPMPSRARSSQTFNVTGEPQRILNHDPRRKIARLVAASQDPFYAASAEELSGVASGKSAPNGAQWPRGVVLEVTDSEELWASTGDATSTIVAVITEYWAE